MIQACAYHSAMFVKPHQWPTPSESIAIYCVRKLLSCITHLQSLFKSIWIKMPAEKLGPVIISTVISSTTIFLDRKICTFRKTCFSNKYDLQHERQLKCATDSTWMRFYDVIMRPWKIKRYCIVQSLERKNPFTAHNHMLNANRAYILPAGRHPQLLLKYVIKTKGSKQKSKYWVCGSACNIHRQSF